MTGGPHLPLGRDTDARFRSIPVVEVFGRSGAAHLNALQHIIGAQVLGIVTGRFGENWVEVYWHPDLSDEMIVLIERSMLSSAE